jgi:hypothetical protein
MVMSIAFLGIPNLLGAASAAICFVEGWRQRSVGFALLGLYLAFELATRVVVAVRDHERDVEYVRNFVPEQVGPNTWTAPVLQTSYEWSAPFLQALLLVAVVLLAQQLKVRKSINVEASRDAAHVSG